MKSTTDIPDWYVINTVHTCTCTCTIHKVHTVHTVHTYSVHVHVQYMSIKRRHTCTVQYNNYSVVSFPHYSSSTVALTVISLLVKSIPQ